METVHFTDLKHLATRGQIERGARYLRCHDLRERPDLNFDGDGTPSYTGAHCYELLTTSHAYLMPRDIDMPKSIVSTRTDTDFWKKKHLRFSTFPNNVFANRMNYHFASDAGLWDLPGIDYINPCNYMLNINEVLRHGIVIDQTTILSRILQNGSKK